MKELLVNLLHFGYLPNDDSKTRQTALKNACEFYTYKVIKTRLEQLEKEFGNDLKSDKSFIDTLEQNKIYPPVKTKNSKNSNDSVWEKVLEMSQKNTKIPMQKFVNLVEIAGLRDYLDSQKGVTLFLPIDVGFNKFGDSYESLLKNPKLAQVVVKNHILFPEVITSHKLSSKKLELKAISGKKLLTSLSDDTILINDSTCLKSDINVINGVIHVIDGVL